jgi:hypothetical protein
MKAYIITCKVQTLFGDAIACYAMLSDGDLEWKLIDTDEFRGKEIISFREITEIPLLVSINKTNN